MAKNEEKEDKTKKDPFEAELKEASLDVRYYYLKEGYKDHFRDLYRKYEKELVKYSIDPKKFFNYTRESFERFKELKKKMPTEPMNNSGYKYVEKNFKDLMDNLRKKFLK